MPSCSLEASASTHRVSVTTHLPPSPPLQYNFQRFRAPYAIGVADQRDAGGPRCLRCRFRGGGVSVGPTCPLRGHGGNGQQHQAYSQPLFGDIAGRHAISSPSVREAVVCGSISLSVRQLFALHWFCWVWCLLMVHIAVEIVCGGDAGFESRSRRHIPEMCMICVSALSTRLMIPSIQFGCTVPKLGHEFLFGQIVN